MRHIVLPSSIIGQRLLLAAIAVLVALTMHFSFSIQPAEAQIVTQPQASLSPSSIAFGNQVVNNTSSVRTVTITSTRSGSACISPDPLKGCQAQIIYLSIRSVTLGGANPEAFIKSDTCTGKTLLQGQSCFVSVQFRPNRTGPFNADLTITSNGAFPGGDNKVELSGTGGVSPDTQPPKVVTVSPPAGTNVGPNANVTATFSEAMNESSVEAINLTSGKPTTFTLTNLNSGNQISAIVTYDSATKTATLDPVNELNHGASYRAKVTTAAKDLADNPLDQDPNLAGNQEMTWKFVV